MNKTALQRSASAMAIFAGLAVFGGSACADVGMRTVTPASNVGSVAKMAITDSASNDVTSFAFFVYYKDAEATLLSVENPHADDPNGQVFPANPSDDNPTPVPLDVETVDPLTNDGFDRRIFIFGDNVVGWQDVGDLAYLNFQSKGGPISTKLEGHPVFTYLDTNVDEIALVIDDSSATSYLSPVITDYTPQGSAVERASVTVTVTGSNFYNDGPGGAPDTRVFFNGTEVVYPTVVGNTIQFPVAANALTADNAYSIVVSNDQSGTDPYVDDTRQFYAVNRNTAYVDAAISTVDAGDVVADLVPYKVKGENAFDTIQGGATNVNTGQSVTVAAGAYNENIAVTKAMSITGAGDTQSIVSSTGSAYHQILMNINAANVAVSGLGFDVTEFVGGAIQAQGDNISVADCDFVVTGFAATPANRGPVAVPNFPRDFAARGITYYGAGTNAANANSITAKGNTFRKTVADRNVFARSLMLIQAEGVIGGALPAERNSSGEGVAYRDLDMRVGSFGSVVNNWFASNVDVNGSYGPVTLSQNVFGNGADWLHNEAALTIRAVSDANASVLVMDNEFVQTGRGVWVGGTPRPVTIDANEFHPAASISASNLVLGDLGTDVRYTELQAQDDEYAHVLIDTRHVTSQSYANVNVTVSNNKFFDSAANGNAIQVKNLGSANTPTITETMTLNFTGNQFNALSSAADNFVKLDGSFAGTLDLASGANQVDTGSGLATVSAATALADLFEVEDHTFHSLDANGTGLVRWVAQNIYVTDLSDKIQRGVNAADAGDTVRVQAGNYDEYSLSGTTPVGLNIDKQITLLGPNAGVAGNAVRGNEAVIRPGGYLNATSTLNPGYTRKSDWHSVVYIEAANVVFDGFKVTGENADLVGGEGPVAIANMNLAAATGIYTEADGIVVRNNIAEKFSYMGIWSGGYWASYNTVENIHFANNLVQDVQTDEGYGYGYYIGGSSGIVENNHAVNVRTGMNIQPYDNVGATAICRGNHLNAWKLGLWYNYTENNTTAWQLTDNHITAAAIPTSLTPSTTWDGTVWTGIATQTLYANANGGSLNLNTVNGTGATLPDTFGIQVRSSVPTPTNALVFEGNTIESVDVGIRVGIQDTATYAGKVTLQNNNEVFNTEVAVLIDSPNNVAHTIIGNNIHDNVVGIKVRNGGKAIIEANTLQNNARQLAFEVTAADDSSVTVNGATYSPAAKSAAELEAIVNGNAVVGKTYISTGMGATQGVVVAEAEGSEQFINVRNTINGSFDASPAGNTTKVMAGTYNEAVFINKTQKLLGAGADVTTVVGPHTGAMGRTTFALRAPNSSVSGFTVTRDGNTAALWAGNLLSELVTIGAGSSNGVVENNIIRDGRSGLYVENTGTGNVARNNRIINNHTGVHIVGGISELTVENNFITENRTAGVLFREDTASNFSDNITVKGNHIAGNWLSQVLNRYQYSDTLDLSGNWFGTATVVTQQAERLSPEPAYSAWRPHYYEGGPGAAPGNALVISGVGHNKIDYNSWLPVGTEVAGASTTDLGFQGDFSTLHIAAASPLAGTENSHVSDAVKLLEDGALTGNNRLILADSGTYNDGVAVVNKPVTIQSLSGDPASVIFRSVALNQNGFEIQENDVTIQNISVGQIAAPYAYRTAINRVTGPFNNTKIHNVTVTNAGSAALGAYAVVLGQPQGSANSTGNTVTGSRFSNCAYAGLALLGGETQVSGNHFLSNSYQGIYAAPDGNSQGGTRPVAQITGNLFDLCAVGVRLNTVGTGTVVGGPALASVNTFNLGTIAGAPGMGVSVEGAPALVENNTFTLGNATSVVAPYGELFSVGAYVWGTEATFKDNRFNGTGKANSKAIGVLAVGERTGVLAGIPGSNESNATHVVVDHNNIEGLDIGVALMNSASPAQAAKLTVSGSSAPNIKNNDTSVLIDGAYATADINASYMNGSNIGVNIKAASAASTFDNITFVRPDDNAKYMVNTSGNEYDVSTNSFDTVTPNSAAATAYASMFGVADYLVDELDETGNGYLRLKSGYVYVPVSKLGMETGDTNGLITRAGLAAVTADNIILQEGTYNDATANLEKYVTLTGAVPYMSNMALPVVAELPSGSGTLTVQNLTFNGNGSVTVVDADRNAGGEYLVEDNLFSNLGNFSTALTVDRVTVAGKLNKNVVTNSGAGILLKNTQNATVEENIISNGFATGIEVMRAPITGGGSEASGIVATGLEIIKNVVETAGRPGTGNDDTEKGTTGDVAGTMENGKAYGIFVGRAGGATGSSATGLVISDNEVRGNAATGVAMWYVDGANGSNAPTVSLVDNNIEMNGMWRMADNQTYGQNTDGVKLRHTSNVVVAGNMIVANVRNNVLVEGSFANTGMGVILSRNHLDSNIPRVLLTPAPGAEGGALMVQITSPQAATTVIDANDNWWGHVYGPESADNVAGRGAKIVEIGAAQVDASSWYGQRSEAEKWYQLNDSDGDGVVDAREDFDLDRTYDAMTAFGQETWFNNADKALSRDSDNDGYEDGAERVCGSDPNNALSTPMDPNGDGNTDDAHALAPYASYRVEGTVAGVQVGGSIDTDGDRYLDFYEVGQGANPNHVAAPDANRPDSPTLGRVKTDIPVAGGQVTQLRRLLLGQEQFKSTEKTVDGEFKINQDNGDLNRDGVVNNADLVFLRRYVALTAPSLPIVIPPVSQP